MMIQKNLNALLLSLLLMACNALAAAPSTGASDQPSGQQLEIQVSGMTCPFCVYGVEKKLAAMKGVESVRVSLKDKRAQLVMKPGHGADVSAIRAAITDAGFTAGKIHVTPATVPAPAAQ